MNLILVIIFSFLMASCMSCSESVYPPGQSDGDVRVIWSYDRDYNFNVADIAQPVIVGDRVYMIHDKRMICRGLKDGKEYWVAQLDNFNSINTRKLLYSNGALFYNWHYRVYAYDAEDGKRLWKTSIPDFTERPLEYMAQNETHLFVPGKGKVARVNKLNGNVDLMIPLTDLIPDSVEQGSGALTATDDGKLYVPTEYFRKNYYLHTLEGSVLCYSSETGELLWGYKLPNHKIKLEGRVDSSYTGAGVQEVSVYNEFLAAQAGMSVFLFNRHTGKLIWEKRFENDGFFSIGVKVYEDKVYASSTWGYLYCLSIEDGRLLWKVNTRNSLIAVLNIWGNRLYFCNDGGSGIWVVDKDTGEVIWNGRPPEYKDDEHNTYFSPVETNGEYMVNVGQWKVYCLTVPK